MRSWSCCLSIFRRLWSATRPITWSWCAGTGWSSTLSARW